MITFKIDQDIRKEIISTIAHYAKMIENENKISQDLRHFHKIEEWQGYINNFNQSLINGYI